MMWGGEIPREQKGMRMKIDLGNNEYLNFDVTHRMGKFCIYVRKEFVEEKQLDDGTKYQVVNSYPFANGNFYFVVKEGRKSAKFIEKIESYLESHKDELLKLWLAGEYPTMVGMIKTGVN